MGNTAKSEHETEKCGVCDAILPIKVCRSAAGYFIGTSCDRCGPHSRFSGYTRNRQQAQRVLNTFLSEAFALRNYFYCLTSPRSITELCCLDPISGQTVIRYIRLEGIVNEG
jgi:hypothetical protein